MVHQSRQSHRVLSADLDFTGRRFFVGFEDGGFVSMYNQGNGSLVSRLELTLELTNVAQAQEPVIANGGSNPATQMSNVLKRLKRMKTIASQLAEGVSTGHDISDVDYSAAFGSARMLGTKPSYPAIHSVASTRYKQTEENLTVEPVKVAYGMYQPLFLRLGVEPLRIIAVAGTNSYIYVFKDKLASMQEVEKAYAKYLPSQNLHQSRQPSKSDKTASVSHGEITALEFVAPSFIVSGTSLGVATVFDIKQHECIAQYTRLGSISCLASLPRYQLCAIGAEKADELLIINPKQKPNSDHAAAEISLPLDQGESIVSMAVTSTSELLFAGGSKGSVAVWMLEKPEHSSQLDVFPVFVNIFKWKAGSALTGLLALQLPQQVETQIVTGHASGNITQWTISGIKNRDLWCFKIMGSACASIHYCPTRLHKNDETS